MIARVVSGGQTGVDRASLDVALELGLPCGGWCPKGRLAEDGKVPDRYPLDETPTRSYPQRTRLNVRDADATLILSWGEPEGGTLLTVRECQKQRKPHLVFDLAGDLDPSAAAAWIKEERVGVLNVAGPRASKTPLAYDRAVAFLREVLGTRGSGAEIGG